MAYRDNIDRLARRITDRIPVKFKKLKEDDPEYKCLSEILNDEQCNLCLFFEVRKPMSFEEILKRTGWEEERVERVLKEVCDIGMIEYNWENEDHYKQYVMPQFVPGSAEFMVMNNDLVKEHPVVTDFFEQMTRLPLEKVTPMVPPGGAGIGMHVIPVEKSIEANQEAVSVEKISHWLNKYDKYALSPCSCRRQQRVRGEGTGDIEADVCIAVGDMADYVVETNKGGHYCTYEDVIETLERCERKGYVHQITNIDGEDKIFAICNCAAGVCNALRTSQLFNTPNMSASAYRAHVDVSKCVACGKCVEVCPVGAAKLGQKLCTKKGPIEYPQVELPDVIKWGPDHWNPDFRDTAKVNCHETGTAPCKTACPAHLPVQGYIKMASVGRYMDALKLIKDFNPFPAVCGSICNRRCEQECTRGLLDAPLAIDEIKKFIAERELNEEERYIPLCENEEGGFYPHKMAIIGAGPAGMSAAYYLRIKGYPVTVFEKEEKPGGMLRYGIPSFRLEKDVIDAEIEVLKAMGIEFRCGVEIGKDITIDSIDDAIKLIQMGANYYKKVEQLKPAQKIVSMLEKAQMLDESKLSFAIDLLNKDPAAIQSLVGDMDISDVLDEKHNGYVPKDHSVSDVQLNLDNVINDVASTPTGHITLKVLGEQWDQASRQIVVSNPSIIGLINQHVADGTFDTVTREVEKRRMLGQIPQGLNDIEAYKFVGDQLYANGNATTAHKGQQRVATNANAKPIVKPSKETVVNKKRAASNIARNSSQSVSQNMDDVFVMSDEEFKAKYGKF